MSISQRLQRRAITPRSVPDSASANELPAGLVTKDGSVNIAGDVVEWTYPDRAPIGGGIEDPKSPKPAPVQGPNATY